MKINTLFYSSPLTIYDTLIHNHHGNEIISGKRKIVIHLNHPVTAQKTPHKTQEDTNAFLFPPGWILPFTYLRKTFLYSKMYLFVNFLDLLQEQTKKFLDKTSSMRL